MMMIDRCPIVRRTVTVSRRRCQRRYRGGRRCANGVACRLNDVPRIFFPFLFPLLFLPRLSPRGVTPTTGRVKLEVINVLRCPPCANGFPCTPVSGDGYPCCTTVPCGGGTTGSSPTHCRIILVFTTPCTCSSSILRQIHSAT
jgi:hypothetical protein